MARQKLIKCQNDGFRFLTARILDQSKRDLRGDDPLAALDALIWWLWGDAWLFCDALGLYLSPYYVLRWLVGGLEDDKQTELS